MRRGLGEFRGESDEVERGGTGLNDKDNPAAVRKTDLGVTRSKATRRRVIRTTLAHLKHLGLAGLSVVQVD